MDEIAKKKIDKAKIQLIIDSPFYATVILETPLIEDDKIRPKTACTNGKWIRYHPEYVNSLTDKKCRSLLAHEILHIVLLHHIRREGRKPVKWNVAADYVVNHFLEQDNFEIPPDWLLDIKYNELSPEEIYNKIPDPPEIKIYMKGSNGDKKEGEEVEGEGIPGLDGIVIDADKDTSFGEEEARVKEIVTRGIQQAKREGKLPFELKRQMEELLKPRIAWERLLHNWINTKAQDDYSWMKRNPRIKNYYMPGLYSEELGTVVIAIDTSGSIDTDQYTRFISEIVGLRSKYKFECIFMSCDTKIPKEPKRYNKHQNIDYQDIHGGGGTSFIPPFEWVKEHNVKPIGLIYFTDLYCNDFPNFMPDYDVMWLNYGGRQGRDFANVPFGKVIDMDV